MTKLQTIINLIADDVKKELNGYYSDWEIENWSEMLYAFGQTSSDFKEDCRYLIDQYLNDNRLDWLITDDLEIETEEGKLVPYRKWISMVRKEVFA